VAMSFIETVAFVPYMHFTNIVLLAPEGLPNGECAWLPTTHAFSQREYNQLALGSHIRTVELRIVGINRAQKHVYLSDGHILPYVGLSFHRLIFLCRYDVLVIAVGMQHGHELMRGAPFGAFAMDGHISADKLTTYLKDSFAASFHTAVVYPITIVLLFCYFFCISPELAATDIR